jgi:hypothetical protein
MRAAVALLALLPFAAIAADDLKPLSDEFYAASTLARWQRVYAVEGWGTNQLELQDINTTRTGFMVKMPFTSIWYQDYRGELTFKEVQGDFVVTTAVDASSRAGSGPPRSSFSLGGIVVPAPRTITPATWQPGGENYIFLSIGSASNPGTFQFEVKTTTNSNPVLEFQNASSGHAIIQVARIGPHFITLKNDGAGWSVHRRYYRPDMPAILQVGSHSSWLVFAWPVPRPGSSHSGSSRMIATRQCCSSNLKSSATSRRSPTTRFQSAMYM